MSVRGLGLGLQFGIFFWVKYANPELLGAFIEAAFLSTIGLSISKAGDNFRAIRGAAQSGATPQQSVAVAFARFVLAVCVMEFTATVWGGSGSTLASLPGAALGVIHNAVYRRFLEQRRGFGLIYSLLGAIHYVLIYAAVDALDGSDGEVLRLGIGMTGTIALGALLYAFARGNVQLSAGELTYIYAYPLTCYWLAANLQGDALWWFFISAKIVDGVAVTLAFVYQPALHRLEWRRKEQVFKKLRRWLDVAAFVMLAAVLCTDVLIELTQTGALIEAAVGGALVAAYFQMIAPAAFILVSIAREERDVLFYGLASLLIPLGALMASIAWAYGWGTVAAVLAIAWAVQHLPSLSGALGRKTE